MLTTLASYRLVSQNLTRTLKTTADQPQVARETQYYLDNIKNVKSIDDLLSNDRLFNYAMKAYGLGDMSYAKAFMRKVLTEGVDSNNTFANTLTDTRYREFATAFNFKANGENTTSLTAAGQDTVDLYVRQQTEEDAGNQNDGVRLALYFERKASGITSSYGVLADAALLKVVETALGLPTSMSLLDIDKQAEIISNRIDVKDFQDPAKLQTFLTRFSAMWDVENPSNTATDQVSTLFSGQTQTATINQDVLFSLQNLRLGGN